LTVQTKTERERERERKRERDVSKLSNAHVRMPRPEQRYWYQTSSTSKRTHSIKENTFYDRTKILVPDLINIQENTFYKREHIL